VDKNLTVEGSPDFVDSKCENHASVKDGAVKVEYTGQENRAVIKKSVLSPPFVASR
jgi:hypothetical protein